ncbi:MAG: tetratricopeptide repeat protein [Bacteroidales bacterium]
MLGLKRYIIALGLLFALHFDATSEITSEAISYRRFMEKNWSVAASGYESILKMGQPLSSTEQYARAIISAAQLKESSLLFFFVRKFQEDTQYSVELSKCIYEALNFANMDSLLESTLFFISDKDFSFSEQMKKFVISQYMKQSRYDDVSRVLKDLLDEYPLDNSLLKIMANFEHFRGNSNNAIDLAKRVISSSPDDLDANILLGNIYLLDGENKLELLNSKYSESNQKRVSTLEYETQVDIILSKYMTPAEKYLYKANSLQSTSYLRDKLKEIDTIRTKNQKALSKLKAYQ